MIDRLIQNGWGYHDSDTERLAEELESVTFSEITPDQANPFLKLSNHTIGEHLGDWSRARQLAEKVCSQQAVADNSHQAWGFLAVARYLDGDGDGSQSQVAELRSLQASGDNFFAAYLEVKIQIAKALIASKRFDEGGELYISVVDLASSLDGPQTSDRAIAIASNGIASELLEASSRAVELDKLMLTSARTSLKFWKKCGTWENEERGLYLLILVGNALLNFEESLTCADMALKVISENGGEPVDEAFIRLAAANAHRRLGNQQDFDRELELADTLSRSWDDDSLYSWFEGERKKIVA